MWKKKLCALLRFLVFAAIAAHFLTTYARWPPGWSPDGQLNWSDGNGL